MEKTVLSANTILQGRYRIIQLLGHGGMGAVYEAIDENLRCRVTIKETFATDAEREVRRAFAREAQLLANIRHPAVPKVSDYFEQGDGLFFVMEFIPGEDLAYALKLRGSAFPLRDVLEWADALLAALSELHAANPPIVHKDIKPSNLKRSPKGEIFLLDFGLAKGALGQMSTVHGQNYSNLQGHTPHFAPPEQIAHEGTTPRSDLYSLAATLWCLLTNRLPDDASRRNHFINNGEPDPLRPAHELNPEVPKAVSDVLEQAMSLTVTKRPADAQEMCEALREAIEAPIREQAERARRDEEEKIRREAEAAGRRAAEEDFTKRLEEENELQGAALRRLEDKYESALAVLTDELKGVRGEAELDRTSALTLSAQMMSEKKSREEVEAALAAEKRSRVRDQEIAEDALRSTEELANRKLGKMSHELDAERYRARQLESDLRELTEETGRLKSLLEEKSAGLEQAERERNKARWQANAAQSQLARVERELHDSQHPVTIKQRFWESRIIEKLSYAFFLIFFLLAGLSVVAAVVLVGVGIYGTFKSHDASPQVTVSEDKSKVNVGGVEIETVRIQGGPFLMGSSDKDAGRRMDEDEKPQHQVTVRDFNIGKYEVTQAQWRAILKLPKVQIDLKASPSTFEGDDLPVEGVTWDEAVEFCARLSKASGVKYRLPTEAEWEYAARGGASSPFTADPDPLAWSADNSGKQAIDPTQDWSRTNFRFDNQKYEAKLKENGCQTHPVGQKQANAFGLYDTLGNVEEWCLDAWHNDYNGAPNDGTEWSNGGDTARRICRGGSWFKSATLAHPVSRWNCNPDGRLSEVGFRVVSVPEQ
ncbi:MAG TPA: SUMF1/EgtB/PvdO family nonheme iron enzyme [Pyrinomonadaceae bacterium]|jgi:formylglycine-generating enzyme required for sulfatase activity/serine/threonine protein kinase|nr:SUMF1/EgtB/PvdO family nonheme iron enzyme [Pyrinomonadaceae bacterium]